MSVAKYRHNSQMESIETQFVRLAVTGDLPSLMESDPHTHNHSERQSFLAAAIERGECLVAFTGKRVVGYIVLNYSFFGRGFIPLVVVAPSVRRQGIAQLLFAAAESKCRTEMLFTSTNSSNVEAQRLFARVGFAASGRIENLDEGDPELVYFKRCTVAGAGANPLPHRPAKP